MPKRILLLDPDWIFRSLVNPELEAWGALVSEANNTVEAKALLDQESFALLIVSEELPDTPGSIFIETLAPAITTPIAFISRRPLAPEKMAALLKNKQITLMLQKPLQAVVFSEQIANFLELTYSLPRRQNKSKLPEMLSLLRASYIEELPQHLEEIAQALSQAQDNIRISPEEKDDDSKKSEKSKKEKEQFLDEALRKAHRLNGTCGSYGFTALSELLAGIEKKLLTLAAGKEDSLWREVAKQLENAKTIAARDREDSKNQTIQTSRTTNQTCQS